MATGVTSPHAAASLAPRTPRPRASRLRVVGATSADATTHHAGFLRTSARELAPERPLKRAERLRFFRSKVRRRHGGGAPARSYSPRTVTTYAVKWREPGGQTFVGCLALSPRSLCLDGRRSGVDEPPVNRRFVYEDLRVVRIGRGADRLDGRPALVVEWLDGDYVVAGAGTGAPVVGEIFDRLVAYRSSP